MANAPLMLELNHIRKTFNKGTINEKPARPSGRDA